MVLVVVKAAAGDLLVIYFLIHLRRLRWHQHLCILLRHQLGKSKGLFVGDPDVINQRVFEPI